MSRTTVTPTVETVDRAAFRLLDVYTETLDEDDIPTVRQHVSEALAAFPALNGYTVNVGRIPPTVELRGDPVARAQPYNLLIELPVGELPSNMIVFHELAHLAIFRRYEDGDEVPRTSERYTSLYALARMEPDQIFRDDIPYLGEPSVPADEWPSIARRALEYRRQNGKNSHYVQRAREWLDGGSR